MKPKTSFISVTDQFCGAGGSSLGASQAGTEIVMALNHWKLAVETHNTNFPNTKHDCTDISACDPRRYPATDILITSPECTNHSLAKGKRRKGQGQLSLFDENKVDPSEERSRATMWDVPRFAEYHRYNVIIVENVVDARNWQLFDAWIHAMQLLGYDHEIVYFNSMFAHPTPQSRDRMYVVFWRHGNRRPNLQFKPPAYCRKCEKNVESVQSWKNTRKQWGRYGNRNQYVYCCPNCADIVQPYYYCAANAIDWSIPGERIGDRKKPLKARTLERIAYGLEKFGKRYMLVQTDYSHSDSQRTRLTTDVLPTQTSRQVLAMIAPNQGDKCTMKSILEALPTMTASGQPQFVSMPFLANYYGNDQAQAIDEAIGSVMPTNKHALVIPPFLFSYYGERPATQPIDDPMVTMTAMGNHALVIPPFILSLNHSDDRMRSVEDPAATVMPGANPSLVVPPFVLTLHKAAQERGIEEALSTVVADGNHHFLVTPFLTSYYGNDQAHSVEEAMNTLTALDRHALVQPDTPEVEDCYFRMLRPHEIGAAMAFPESYVVLGNNRDRVRQYGNAVTPPVMQQLIDRCVESLQ
jgi:DNA (cytosine-5)-methyltransferase 1